MKKSITSIFPLQTLLLALGAVFLLVGCESDDVSFEPKILFGSEAQTVSNTGGQYQLELLTNEDWQLSADVDWIQFEQTSGEKGKQVISYSVLPNEDDERSGVLTVTGTSGVTQDLVVTQEAGNRDDIYVTVDGSGEGFSWEDATNLETALEMAVTGNTIHIAAGTYSPTKLVTGGDASDARDLTFEIGNNIALVGGYPAAPRKGDVSDPQTHATILDGAGVYHVVTVSAPKASDQKVVLQGLKITGGKAGTSTTPVSINGTGFRRDYGGGVIVGNATLEIVDSEIYENDSEKFVAGIYVFEDAELTMRGTRVYENHSSSNAGGIWVANATAHVYDSEFTHNSGGTAAGVHAYPDAELYMYNSVVAHNKGRSFGPGVYVRQNSKAVLVNMVIYGNSSTGQHGGGVMMYNNNEVLIVNSTITANKANGSGGGVMKQSNNNQLTIYNSVISGNEQASGTDIGENDNGPAPSFYSSVIAGEVYDQNQSLIADAVFSPASMISNPQEGIYLLVGETNPALQYGMNPDALSSLVSQYGLEEELLMVDFLHNSRESQTIMGAFVSE